MHEEQSGAQDQAAVGHVENRPFNPVKVEKVADAAKDDAVIEIAQRAAKDQAQGGAEEAVP